MAQPEKKIVVPEGMLKAAIEAAGQTIKGCPCQHIAQAAVEAALRWLSECGCELTDAEIQACVDDALGGDSKKWRINFINAVLCRMFWAPEPEIPAEVKDLLCDLRNTERGLRFGDTGDKINDAILEAFRRGQASK